MSQGVDLGLVGLLKTFDGLMALRSRFSLELLSVFVIHLLRVWHMSGEEAYIVHLRMSSLAAQLRIREAVTCYCPAHSL